MTDWNLLRRWLEFDGKHLTLELHPKDKGPIFLRPFRDERAEALPTDVIAEWARDHFEVKQRAWGDIKLR
ncbi:MAG: hypothetical protein JNJ54_00390 [Myxococcaceae bacterium]|nr:hypothetical protein [Myxococcaceae bacterium]